MTDMEIARSLFEFLWDYVAEGDDVDWRGVTEELLRLGLVEERVVDPDSNEWGSDVLYFPMIPEGWNKA